MKIEDIDYEDLISKLVVLDSVNVGDFKVYKSLEFYNYLTDHNINVSFAQEIEHALLEFKYLSFHLLTHIESLQ